MRKKLMFNKISQIFWGFNHYNKFPKKVKWKCKSVFHNHTMSMLSHFTSLEMDLVSREFVNFFLSQIIQGSHQWVSLWFTKNILCKAVHMKCPLIFPMSKRKVLKLTTFIQFVLFKAQIATALQVHIAHVDRTDKKQIRN